MHLCKHSFNCMSILKPSFTDRIKCGLDVSRSSVLHVTSRCVSMTIYNVGLCSWNHRMPTKRRFNRTNLHIHANKMKHDCICLLVYTRHRWMKRIVGLWNPFHGYINFLYHGTAERHLCVRLWPMTFMQSCIYKGYSRAYILFRKDLCLAWQES